MCDPHLFEIDSLLSDQPRMDFSLKIPQGVGNSRKRRPLAQALSLPRLFVRIANDFARHLFQCPFGKHCLRRTRRQKLIGDFDIRRHPKPGDLQVLAVSPDDIQAFAQTQLPRKRLDLKVKLFKSHMGCAFTGAVAIATIKSVPLGKV